MKAESFPNSLPPISNEEAKPEAGTGQKREIRAMISDIEVEVPDAVWSVMLDGAQRQPGKAQR